MKQHRMERLADATTCLVLTEGSPAVGPNGVDKLSDLGYHVDKHRIQRTSQRDGQRVHGGVRCQACQRGVSEPTSS
jgi:hypothetical protein